MYDIIVLPFSFRFYRPGVLRNRGLVFIRNLNRDKYNKFIRKEMDV